MFWAVFLCFTEIGGGFRCCSFDKFRDTAPWYQGSLPPRAICILHHNIQSWISLAQSNTPTFKFIILLTITRFLSHILLNCVRKGSLYEESDRVLKADGSTPRSLNAQKLANLKPLQSLSKWTPKRTTAMSMSKRNVRWAALRSILGPILPILSCFLSLRCRRSFYFYASTDWDQSGNYRQPLVFSAILIT